MNNFSNFTSTFGGLIRAHIQDTVMFTDTSSMDAKTIKAIAHDLCQSGNIPIPSETYELISNYFKYVEDKDRMLVFDMSKVLWRYHRSSAQLENFLQDYFTILVEEAEAHHDDIRKEYARYFFKGKQIHFLAERIKYSMMLNVPRSYDLVEATEHLRYFHLTPDVNMNGKYRALIDLNESDFNITQVTGVDTLSNHFTRIMPQPIASDDTDEPTLWLSLIRKYMCDDDEKVAYFEKVLAYLMSPYNYNQVLIMFLGTKGRNGKSTILKVLQDVLGPHAVRLNSDMLNAKPPVSYKKDDALASTEGRSLLIFNEIDERMIASPQAIKDLTEGGRDEFGNKVMTMVRPAYSPNYEINVCGIPLMAVNNPLRFGDWANLTPVYRRMVIVPFEYVITDEDPTILTRLAEEYPKIQLWLYMNYFKHKGINIKSESKPSAWQQFEKSYQKENDILRLFMDDCIEVTTDPDDKLQCSDIYRIYQRYCRVNGRNPISNKGPNGFGSLIIEYLPDKTIVKINGTRYYRYLKKSFYYTNEVENAPTFA